MRATTMAIGIASCVLGVRAERSIAPAKSSLQITRICMAFSDRRAEEQKSRRAIMLNRFEAS